MWKMYKKRSYLSIFEQINRIRTTSAYPVRYYKQDRKQESGEPQNFSDKHRWRMQQARRTVLLSSPQHCAHNIVHFCSKFGDVANVFTYTRDDKPSTLVEFKHTLGVRNLLLKTEFFPNNDQIPVHSRHLFIKPRGSRNRNSAFKDRRVHPEKQQNLSEFDLMSSKDINQQIERIYTRQTMQDFDVRLRYFVTSNLEDSLQKFLPQCSIQPFGSSVNGFGRSNCDLDMMLDFEDVVNGGRSHAQDNQTYYLTRVRWDTERENSRHVLDSVGGVIRELLPQYSHVYRILNARVPIVKFRHIGARMECDLCMHNKSGIYMSEVLYSLAMCDDRVRPLVFAIRLWARSHDVTHSCPGTWLSNFQLTLVIVHFLQKLAVLPLLVNSDTKGNPLVTSKLSKWSSANQQPLDELLLQFFDYYGNVINFDTTGISLIHSSFEKPNADKDLYLQNPIDQDLNAGKTVKSAELDKFQSCCREAYEMLKTEMQNGQSLHSEWGLLTFLKVDGLEEEKEKGVIEGAFEVRDKPLRHCVLKDTQEVEEVERANKDNGLTVNGIFHLGDEDEQKEGEEEVKEHNSDKSYS